MLRARSPAGQPALLPQARQPAPKENLRVKANLVRLNPADQVLAAAQKLCPVTGGPLGGMGVPVKLMLDNQPVFLCCGSCTDDARKDVARTLERVKKLQAQVKDARARP